MRLSKLFGKTTRTAKTYDSVNATLLQKAGFIDMVMAGVYNYLPLGLMVLTKIENIIREEMNTVASEVLMTSLSPRSFWEQTNRIDSVDVLMKTSPANDLAKQKNDSEYILNPTHEEMVTPLVQKFVFSYKDLPAAVYQIQTKFRNEPRVKSGLMRGREFRMKDMYSFHASMDDFKVFYEKSKEVYKRVFDRLGIGKETVIALASGGAYTKEYSHEFQTICETGEDTICLDEETHIYYNKEVAPEGKKFKTMRAAEVGNIFPLGDKFTKAWQFSYTNIEGKEAPIYMGSYGIGPSRVMGVIVEKMHDEKGMIWPKNIAPAEIYLIAIGKDEETVKSVDLLYKELQSSGKTVLYDDRDVSPGQKFSDADLIGIPYRLVVSPKTNGKIEFKKRTEKETKVVSFEELSKLI